MLFSLPTNISSNKLGLGQGVKQSLIAVCFTGPEHNHLICGASRPNQVVFIKVSLMDSTLSSPGVIYHQSRSWRS